MMHQGLDLSKFKKVGGDKKSVTLRHSKGHEIKVAASAMSPAMRDQIEKLPIYMAEGGEAQAIDPESPAGADTDTPEETGGQGVPEEALPEESPETPVTEEEPRVEPRDHPRYPNPPQEVPAQNTFTVTAPRRAAPTPQELDNEDALVAQDMQRGHLKPETMEDLFAKKDTLGKIGTIFGLLLSSAGAGLSRQPNALLEMMKNEINNDFEAQKLSNSNAQNWLRLSQNHELQKAQLGQMGVQNELTRAQIGKVPSEIAQNEAHTANLKADAMLKGAERARNMLAIGAYQHLQNQVDKYPAGQSRESAQNMLDNVIAPAIQQNNAENNAKLSGQLNARQALRGNQPKPQAVNYDKLQLLKRAGAAASAVGAVGDPNNSMDQHEATLADEESKNVEANRAIYQTAVDSFEHLDRSLLAGKLNPADRNAAVALVAAKIKKMTGASTDEAKAQADALFPGVADWLGARQEKANKLAEDFANNEAGSTILDRFGLRAPFPGPPRLSGGKKEAVAKNETRKTTAPKESPPMTKEMHGAQYKKVPGGWQKAK